MEQLAVQYGAPTHTAQYDIEIANNMMTKMKLLLRFQYLQQHITLRVYL
jgi:hypothetical protein